MVEGLMRFGVFMFGFIVTACFVALLGCAYDAIAHHDKACVVVVSIIGGFIVLIWYEEDGKWR
jgi:hypothetical protein